MLIARLFIVPLSLFLFSVSNAQATTVEACPKALDHSVKTLVGDKHVNLCRAYLGNVVLIVNTASKCGYTPQYDGLEKLYDKYKSQGFVVLGFPSNDFGGQEPGDAQQIKSFCRLTYGVKFPMFEKTHAAQPSASPIYQTLGEIAGVYPTWNFHKYLLDRNGKLVANYASKIEPLNSPIEEKIKALLSNKQAAVNFDAPSQ